MRQPCAGHQGALVRSAVPGSAIWKGSWRDPFFPNLWERVKPANITEGKLSKDRERGIVVENMETLFHLPRRSQH